MIFVDIDTAQFYQLPKAISICKNGQPAVSSLRLFIALKLSEKEKMKTLISLEQIENLDMTSLPLKKPLNPFHV